jgi:hypothetical protein
LKPTSLSYPGVNGLGYGKVIQNGDHQITLNPNRKSFPNYPGRYKVLLQSGSGRELRVRLTNRFLAVAFVLTAGSVLAAQTKDEDAKARFEQSAKGFLRYGGLVNSVDGQAGCICGNVSVSALRAKRALSAGDTIKVGAGRVEILLNPGYYLRLGPNTEARLLDLTPGNLKIKLVSGAAIVEIAMDAYGNRPREMANRVFDIVTLITPRDEYAISRPALTDWISSLPKNQR